MCSLWNTMFEKPCCVKRALVWFPYKNDDTYRWSRICWNHVSWRVRALRIPYAQGLNIKDLKFYLLWWMNHKLIGSRFLPHPQHGHQEPCYIVPSMEHNVGCVAICDTCLPCKLVTSVKTHAWLVIYGSKFIATIKGEDENIRNLLHLDFKT
jgi:hypothetical protein